VRALIAVDRATRSTRIISTRSSPAFGEPAAASWRARSHRVVARADRAPPPRAGRGVYRRRPSPGSARAGQSSSLPIPLGVAGSAPPTGRTGQRCDGTQPGSYQVTFRSVGGCPTAAAGRADRSHPRARSRQKLGSDPNRDHRRDPPAFRPKKRTRLPPDHRSVNLVPPAYPRIRADWTGVLALHTATESPGKGLREAAREARGRRSRTAPLPRRQSSAWAHVLCVEEPTTVNLQFSAPSVPVRRMFPSSSPPAGPKPAP